MALDIVIADGMSTDGTREILDEYTRFFPGVQVIDNPNRIASYGLNLAVQQSIAEFIIRLDAHTRYPPEYVVRCISVSINTEADNVGGSARTLARSFWERAIAAGFHASFATGGASFRQEYYTGFTDTVPYGCWRRALLLRLGLFDETLVRNQDDELNLRLRRAGGTVWQDASIVSYYRPRSTLRALFQQYFQYGFWRVAVLRKHRVVASPRQLAPVAALATGTSLVLCIAFSYVLRKFSLGKWSMRGLGLLSGIYALGSAASSITAAKRNGWDLLPVLPIVFATYQFSYAVGFTAGLLRRVKRP